ncbi:MAG: chromosome segregation protein SMC, partial [Alphaproteobacteria bacterium]|nr:chromosome segregation protein SMC [Alphaproteobacteria bacterium]
DFERESALAADARHAFEHLMAEKATIDADCEGEEAAQAETREALEEAQATLHAREDAFNSLTEAVAKAEARATALARQRDELQQRLARLRGRMEEIGAERDKLSAEMSQDEALAGAERAVAAAEAAVQSARAAFADAETARNTASEAEAAARTGAQDATARQTKLMAEAQALTEVLESGEADLFPPLIDALQVDPGYETALGAALGDDLTAPIDSAAAVHWATLPPLSAPAGLPGDAAPLSRYVKGPDALNRRLAYVGVIESAAAGADLAKRLTPGQRLVSKDGGLWRWDGYTVQAGAPTPAAKRLQQRNRLGVLRHELEAAARDVAAAEEKLHAAQSTAATAATAERTARQTMEEAYGRLNAARESHGALASTAAGTKSRVSALSETAEQLLNDLRDGEQELAETEAAIGALEDPSEARRRIETLRAEVAQLRDTESQRRAAHDRLVREADGRRQRLAAIEEERQSWQERIDGANARLQHLSERREGAEQRKTRLNARPEEIEQQRATLLDSIERAEQARQGTADRLAEGETALAEADKALRAAEASQAEAREERVRCQAQVEQADIECRTVADRIQEKLGCRPEEALGEAQLDADADLPAVEEAEEKIERLSRQRDSMGPVNLRAETELQELEEQITSMQTEREDLVAAIARLRQGIASLNREGRERLLAAFDVVNKHFEELFVRLFGGGRAHLALTEADDPLEAGLEIMASPPGKKLQIMSLLSGGEQALTALALLFAVFLTNPAPICVLDEVDAPLDDANVDRFCHLLEEIAHAGTTRFLCVTHHRMTMARMDRLFGVTMGERGVSQLVSVDLRRAEELRESA